MGTANRYRAAAALAVWLLAGSLPDLALAGAEKLSGFVYECETAFVDVTFKDRTGAAVTVDWYDAWVDDTQSGVRLWTLGQQVFTVGSALIEIPSVGQQIVHEHSTREPHRLTVSFQYSGTRYGVSVYDYTVEAVDGVTCNLGPTPAPTMTMTPTVTPTATPTPTPTT